MPKKLQIKENIANVSVYKVNKNTYVLTWIEIKEDGTFESNSLQSNDKNVLYKYSLNEFWELVEKTPEEIEEEKNPEYIEE
jgi:hypothetical protein